MARAKGRRPDPGPSLPWIAEILWRDFVSLHASRRAGMGGAEPLAFPDLAAFAQLRGRAFSAWEFDLIVALDREYMDAVADKAKEGRGNG
ncbi:MAG TPA: hypothetical protein VI229_00425 [Burkholderiales bacterium]